MESKPYKQRLRVYSPFQQSSMQSRSSHEHFSTAPFPSDGNPVHAAGGPNSSGSRLQGHTKTHSFDASPSQSLCSRSLSPATATCYSPEKLTSCPRIHVQPETPCPPSNCATPGPLNNSATLAGISVRAVLLLFSIITWPMASFSSALKESVMLLRH